MWGRKSVSIHTSSPPPPAPLSSVPPPNQVEIFSSLDGVEVTSATAWEMQSIWVSKEEVLATPRADGRK